MNWTIILLASILSPLAISCIKQYNATTYSCWLLLAVVMYIGITCFYSYALKNNNTSTIYSYINLLNITIVTLVSIFYFGEKITPKQVLGLVVAVFAIYLLCH